MRVLAQRKHHSFFRTTITCGESSILRKFRQENVRNTSIPADDNKFYVLTSACLRNRFIKSLYRFSLDPVPERPHSHFNHHAFAVEFGALNGGHYTSSSSDLRLCVNLNSAQDLNGHCEGVQAMRCLCAITYFRRTLSNTAHGECSGVNLGQISRWKRENTGGIRVRCSSRYVGDVRWESAAGQDLPAAPTQSHHWNRLCATTYSS